MSIHRSRSIYAESSIGVNQIRNRKSFLGTKNKEIVCIRATNQRFPFFIISLSLWLWEREHNSRSLCLLYVMCSTCCVWRACECWTFEFRITTAWRVESQYDDPISFDVVCRCTIGYFVGRECAVVHGLVLKCEFSYTLTATSQSRLNWEYYCCCTVYTVRRLCVAYVWICCLWILLAVTLQMAFEPSDRDAHWMKP